MVTIKIESVGSRLISGPTSFIAFLPLTYGIDAEVAQHVDPFVRGLRYFWWVYGRFNYSAISRSHIQKHTSEVWLEFALLFSCGESKSVPLL